MEFKEQFIREFKENIDNIKVSDIKSDYSLLEELRGIKLYLEEFIETIKKPKGLIGGIELKFKTKDGRSY